MNKELHEIIRVMYQTHGRDISVYDESFLAKSLEKRRSEAGVETLAAYLGYLSENSTEAEVFFRLLNTYSKFFRNQLTFTLIEQWILPKLIEEKAGKGEIRIWSAGCAAGQEAYSIAILLDKYSASSSNKIRFRIFATDTSQSALALAREGVYDAEAVQNVMLKHLCTYFTNKGETYTITSRLKYMVNFSTYDFLDKHSANPPESIYGDFDIVFCSNLLFYYRSDIRQFILQKVHRSLSERGYLITGEILLDIIMPGMDGFEVCRILKSDERLQKIPVLFLTALKTSKEIRVKALEAGAEAFLTKPFDETELFAQILSMAKIKAANVLQRQENERLEALVAERTLKIEHELSARRIIEQELRDSEEKYRLLIENQTDMIVKTDIAGRFLYASPSYCRLFGKLEKELLGNVYKPQVHIDDRLVAENALASMLNPPYTSSYEERVQTINGWRWIQWDANALFGERGEIIGFIRSGRDVTERKKREEEILYLNYHDILTGLFNRSFLAEEIKRLDTERQLPISVIMGDINGLKLVNDAFGHAEGDKLLVETAKILKRFCRKEDILARIGGDEFCILLPQTSGENVNLILNRINAALEEYEKNKERETYYLSIALGYAAKTIASESFESVLKNAEDFMYKRKLLENKSLHSSIISSIKTTLFEKSHETEAHAERLVELSKVVGKELLLSDEHLNELQLLSTLHDIGKISIDDHILTKPDKLNDFEWSQMKKHPEVGYRIAMASADLMHIAEYILCHHEHWNGNGYPQGLVGENIPLLSRILAVVDAYDAMTQDRPYRKGISQEDAIAEIRKNAGTQFDPRIARIFIEKVLDKSQ